MPRRCSLTYAATVAVVSRDMAAFCVRRSSAPLYNRGVVLADGTGKKEGLHRNGEQATNRLRRRQRGMSDASVSVVGADHTNTNSVSELTAQYE